MPVRYPPQPQLVHLRWEDYPQSFGGSPHKMAQNKEAFAFCLPALTVARKFIQC